jgi:cysteine-dependent adenosine diphosphate thiazole synthase
MSLSQVATTLTPVDQALKQTLASKAQTNGHHYDVSEDYAGRYRFAPIEEAQVTRAMIKRSVFSLPPP